MDLDPSLYVSQNTTPPRSPSPPLSTPLPPIALPSAPRPSVSPSVSRVFQKKHTDAAPAMSGGLDLSAPRSPLRTENRSLGPQWGAQPSSRNQDSTDARDTASARDNILNLVSAGQRTTASSGSSTPSLAMFMGGGAQRRTHRVGTGMTEQEKEETERLEREMAATRAKWGDKGAAQDDAAPPRGGMSLAALMRGGTGGASAAAKESPVAQKVAQRYQPAAAETSAPAAASTAPQVAKPASPPLVEAKIVSPTTRSPPSFPDPESTTSPRLTSSALGGNTLTRLQSSHIVADRLKWTEALQQHASDAVDAPAAPVAAPPSPEKRRSVVERWGRDAPNVAGAMAAAPASPVASRRRSIAQEQVLPRDELSRSPERVEEATIETAKVEDVDMPETVANDVAPKLTHITRDRARPTKSTPRTLSSTSSSSKPSSPPVEKASAPAVAPVSSPPVDSSAPSSAKAGYIKPTWSAAPIGVKEPAKPLSPPPAADEEPASPEVRHTRGVALPGLSGAALKPASARPAPLVSPASPTPAPAKKADEPASPGGISSVRAAAMRWGQTAAQSAAEKSEALQALKASYGVKLAAAPQRQQTMPPPASARREEVEPPVKSRSVEVRPREGKVAPAPVAPIATPPVPVASPASEPTPSPAPAAAPAAAPALKAVAPMAAPVASAPQPAKRAATSPLAQRSTADDIVSAVLAPRSVAHLPPGETLSLDIFHLNSPSADPYPIDHNHMLFSSEIVGIVHRQEGADGQGIQTQTWVWFGRDADETERTGERIARLAEKTGTEPVEVGSGEEGADLAEAFAGQLTVCRGRRDEFDHLAKRMFSVQSHDGAVFVEEANVSIRTLCSGYCTVFSSLGEVYAWLGEGSTDLERNAACEFAESLADGRAVAVLAEGEETALFWHQLAADGEEYASAHYWRYRPLHPQSASLIRLSPSSSDPFALIPSLELSPSHVSLLDGGYAEVWVIVPEAVLDEKKADVGLALEAAEKLAANWEERGFPSRTPFHVLLTPSLIPRDLPFLARALDFAPLNEGAEPRKMRVYTAEEAREELL
ncbi:hypothetical protein JCM10450v2_006346 [Rhodotorula kratochvilovae]